MRLLRFLEVIFLCGGLQRVAAAVPVPVTAKEEDHGVITLTNVTFNEYIRDNPSVFVLFYASWCFWSRQLIPQFEDASRVVTNSDPPVAMAMLDGPANIDILDAEGVFLFPTMKFYLDGEPHDYEGGRHHSQIVKWILEHIKHEQAISTPEQLKQILRTHESEVVLLAAFGESDKRNESFKKNFMMMARRYDNIFFADVSSPETLEAFQEYVETPVEPPFLYVFNPYAKVDNHESPIIRYNGKLEDYTGVNQFINKHRFPALIKFDLTIASIVFNANRAIFLYIGNEGDEIYEIGLEALRNVSEEYRDRLIFMHAGYAEANEKRLARLVGIEDDEKLPTTRVFKVNSSGLGQWRPAFKYKAKDEDISLEGMKTFADQYVKNQLRPYLKSDPIADFDEEEGPVKTIVGLDFDDRVRNSHSDVFIVFHAPWCGHCRKLEPALNTLATKLASIQTLMIAKLDATANEVEGVFITAYPTLMLWAGGSDRPKVFSGERSVSEMSKWLEESVTHKFRLGDVLMKYQRTQERNVGGKRFVVEEL